MALTLRRYYLRKRLSCAAVGDTDLAAVWQAHQEAAPGVALPADFPARAALAAAGYTTAEDLGDADRAELARAGLTYSECSAVLAAMG